MKHYPMKPPLFLTLLITTSFIFTLVNTVQAAESSAPLNKPLNASSNSATNKTTSSQKSQETSPAAQLPKKPAIGAISKSTGHLFREGLASGIAADRVTEKTIVTANDHGLLSTKKQGSLGNNIWDGFGPDLFADMMKKLEPNTNIPILNPLARRLLLTDSPWPEGAEFRALRLEKMLAFGATQESARLYNFWSPDSGNIRLARAGAEALYRTGETATACLEINANPDIPKAGNAFWDMAKKTCTILKFDPNPSKSSIPESVTLILSALPTDLRTDVIALYAEQSADLEKNITERVNRLFDLFPKMPWSARALFAPTFSALPSSYTTDSKHIHMILGSLLAANTGESASWVKRLRTTLPDPLTSDPAATALLLLAQMRGFDGQKNPIPFKFSDDLDAHTHHLGKLFIKLTELLDTEPNFIDNPSVTYEKRRDLTQADHYVMPVDVLRSSLTKGRENHARGQMLLASLLTLQSNEIGAIDPDLFSDIITYMVSAGLNEEARQTATYVFLGALRLGE